MKTKNLKNDLKKAAQRFINNPEVDEDEMYEDEEETLFLTQEKRRRVNREWDE